jgi:hypothetical protein
MPTQQVLGVTRMLLGQQLPDGVRRRTPGDNVGGRQSRNCCCLTHYGRRCTHHTRQGVPPASNLQFPSNSPSVTQISAKLHFTTTNIVKSPSVTQVFHQSAVHPLKLSTKCHPSPKLSVKLPSTSGNIHHISIHYPHLPLARSRSSPGRRGGGGGRRSKQSCGSTDLIGSGRR